MTGGSLTLDRPELTGMHRLATLLSGIVVLGLLLLCAGFFFFPDYGGVGRVFYLLVLLPAVLALLPWSRGLGDARLVCLYLAPVAWLAVSTVWGPGEAEAGRSLWYLCKPVLFLYGLLIATAAAIERFPGFPVLLLKLLCVVALVTALLSLANYVVVSLENGKWDRMGGISLRGDVNVTASLYGMTCLFCAWGLRHWPPGWRPLLAACMICCASIVLLSRSKVPVLMIGGALLWLLWESRSEAAVRTALRVLLLPLLSLLAMAAYFIGVPLLDRPEGYTVRLDLWQQSFAHIEQGGFAGHGLGTDIPLFSLGKPLDSHAHNMLLDTMLYGGWVGGALLCLQLVISAGIAVRVAQGDADYIAVAIWWFAGVFFLMTNGQQPLVKPHHPWFFFWIPLAMLLARARQLRVARDRAGS